MLTETHSPLISTVSHNGPNTTHSLSTLKDGDLPPPAKSQSELDREIANDQHELDVYGDDDPHEPTPEKTPPSPPNGKDKNMVDWDGPGDPTNPQNWTVGFRWMISALCCLITVNVTFASSAPTSALTFVAKDFDVPLEVSDLLTSLFLVGYIAGPIIWGPGSELLGRRPIFIVSTVAYTLLILGQSLANNIVTLLVTRFLAGVFAAAPLTNSSGVMADMWDPARRGIAVSIFAGCVFIGPVMGPIIGGFVVESHLGWRWIFWIMMILSGFCTALVLFFLPETYAPILLQNKAKRLRKADPEKNTAIYAEHEKQDWSPVGILKRTLYRPFYMLYKEPILVLITIYLSFIYGILYALFEAFPLIFIEKRGFSIRQDGLIFIGVGIGTCLGCSINVCFSARFPELMKKWKGFPPPEERLYGAMIAGPCLVIGSFWFGWSGNYPGVHWIVPALSTIFIGISVSLIFMSLLAYLVDTYLMYSASAFAANVMIRSAVAAAFPLFTVQMFTALGINWACTLLGCISILLMPTPFLFYKYGPRIRRGSTFAPCIDLKIAKEMEADARKQESPV